MRFFATMGMAALSLTAFSTAAIVINEVRTDMSGSDTDEYIELKGMPGESLAGLTLLIIGDGTGTASGTTPATKSGAVEFVWQFGKADVIGSNGFLVLRKDTMVTPIDPGATQVTILPDVATGVFENGQNSTVLLVSGFSGTNTTNGVVPTADGQDLDTDDDGTLDVTPWTAIVDSMVVKQSPGSAPDASNVWWYSANVCGPFISRSTQTTTTGGLLAFWGFNDNALPGGGNGYLAGRFPLSAESGDQAATAVVDIGGGLLQDTITNSAGDTVYQWLQSFGGTTTNALAGVASGGSLAIQGGTGATASGGGNNGSHVEFRLSMAGLSGLEVTWAAQRTSTGFNSTQVSYSTDGTTFTDFGDPITYATGFSLRGVDFGTLLDDAADVRIRLTMTGATASTGNNRLDNVQVLSSPTEETVIVTNYGSPFHCIRNADGTWSQGGAAPAAGLDTPGAENAVIPTYVCGDEGAGDCNAPHANGGCADECCCEEVCSADPFCCDVAWDSFCVTAAADCSGSTDCGTEACPLDLTGDRIIDGADLGVMLGNWGPGGETDLNQDGSVDGVDLGILLGGWGACAG